MSTANYPPTDDLLQQTIAACGHHSGHCNLEISVCRPWQPEPEILAVRYHFERRRPLRADVAGLAVDLNRPLKLLPTLVSKPWGREIWYTGMEARGESRVAGERGSLGLLSYLSLAPDHLCARRDLLLLKALESRPQPRLGELYFEIHRDKQEVYVVTDINAEAYPDNIGSVRFGMNQTLRRQYRSDAQFRAAFAAAVGSYEQARRSADQQTDASAAGSLSDAEAQARARVLEFTTLKPLRCGDVLAVPAGVPHALQHGMRVLEFQTPSYERQIIYSAQKVATQQHWDSAAAIASMQLDPPAEPDPAADIVAAFPEFTVRRIRLDETTACPLPGNLPYALCTPEHGQVRIADAAGELILEPGEAAFIPRSAEGVVFEATTAATLLLAAPGL